MSHTGNREKFSYPSQESAVLRDVNNIMNGYTSFETHAKNVTSVKCSPQGDRVFSADETGYVYIWHANHPELIVNWEFQGSKSAILDCSFTEDGEKIAFVGEISAGKIGKTASLNLKKTDNELAGHNARALTCCHKASRPFKLYTGAEDHTINVFGAPGFTLNKSINHHKGFVNCIRASPDNKFLVSCAGDKSIAIFSTESDEPVKVIENVHAGSVYSACWYEDSQKFVTCSADKTVKVWNVAGELLNTLNVSSQPKVDDMQMGVVKVKGAIISVSLAGTLNVWREENLLQANIQQPDQVIHGHSVNVGHFREQ